MDTEDLMNKHHMMTDNRVITSAHFASVYNSR